MITSQWYKQSEQATRLGIWYSATGIFSVFSGLVNYGLAQAGGSLAPWKAMYVFPYPRCAQSLIPRQVHLRRRLDDRLGPDRKSVV